MIDLTIGFSGLGTDSCKTRRESFKFWHLVRLILETLRYIATSTFLGLQRDGYSMRQVYRLILWRHDITSTPHGNISQLMSLKCDTDIIGDGRRLSCSRCSTVSGRMLHRLYVNMIYINMTLSKWRCRKFDHMNYRYQATGNVPNNYYLCPYQFSQKIDFKNRIYKAYTQRFYSPGMFDCHNYVIMIVNQYQSTSSAFHQKHQPCFIAYAQIHWWW